MKKFSEINKNNDKKSEPKNKKDLIKNLIDDTLSIKDGEIDGKKELVKAINKIVEMTEYKSSIKVLESIKVETYKNGFNFNLINEAIKNENKKIDLLIENNENDIEIENINESNDLDEPSNINESDINSESDIITENKSDEDTNDVDDESDEDTEDTEDTENECDNKTKKIDEAIEQLNNENDNDSALASDDYISDEYVNEKTNLTNIYNNILKEHHLTIREDKMKYILDNLNLIIDDVEGDNDVEIKKKIKNMSDLEIDELYNKVEQLIAQ